MRCAHGGECRIRHSERPYLRQMSAKRGQTYCVCPLYKNQKVDQAQCALFPRALFMPHHQRKNGGKTIHPMGQSNINRVGSNIKGPGMFTLLSLFGVAIHTIYTHPLQFRKFSYCLTIPL